MGKVPWSPPWQRDCTSERSKPTELPSDGEETRAQASLPRSLAVTPSQAFAQALCLLLADQDSQCCPVALLTISQTRNSAQRWVSVAPRCVPLTLQPSLCWVIERGSVWGVLCTPSPHQICSQPPAPFSGPPAGSPEATWTLHCLGRRRGLAGGGGCKVRCRGLRGFVSLCTKPQLQSHSVPFRPQAGDSAPHGLPCCMSPPLLACPIECLPGPAGCRLVGWQLFPLLTQHHCCCPRVSCHCVPSHSDSGRGVSSH